MKKNYLLRTLSVSLGAVMGLGFLAGCGDDSGSQNGGGNALPAYKDNLVIMTEDLNELYNPFYSTSGTDMDVVGQTQISMLSTDENGNLSYGNSEPSLTLDYKTKTISGTDGKEDTEYYFVLKNGLKFSDGTPVTMNDVLFNMYVYLDPAYTGSTTMYSTKILGLQEYRTQEYTTGGTSSEDDTSQTARTYAKNRLRELSDLFTEILKENTNSDDPTQLPIVSEQEMRDAIASHICGPAYMQAIGEEDADKAKEQLLADYNDSLEKFKKELDDDYKSARNSYTDAPYDTIPVYFGEELIRNGFDETISFFYHEGFTDMPETDEFYGRYDGPNGSIDKTQIKKVKLLYDPREYNTQEKATQLVYNSTVPSAYDQILSFWLTGTQMRSEFEAKAKEVLLQGSVDGDQLKIKNISGIVSLGHTSQVSEVTIGSNTYTVAHDHNDDGTPAKADQYDVLRITIDGVDPKAQWNFGFTVAPYHYYSDPGAKNASVTGAKLQSENALTRNLWANVTEVNIEENKFGVAWTDFDFHQKILQGTNTWGESKNKIPVGAGPYIATDRNDSDRPAASGFVSGNTVFYKSNPLFSLDGKTSSEPHIKHMHYEVTQVANALSSLESGQVHFVSPQFTSSNITRINSLKSRGVGSVDSWQLGYGYIGINAGEVKYLDLRKAIMSAMDAKLALEYYEPGTAVNIAFPMSAVNWAYPRSSGNKYDGTNPTANMEDRNGHEYTQFTTDDKAKERITSFTNDAKRKGATDADLEYEFVIAGTNMSDHPAYLVFKKAIELLNACGWKVTMKADATALTKLATGTLAVWAAAWGSTIDPDMYQVYHKNSTATSVTAWGYDDILDNPSFYTEENRILTDLANVIDDARETNDQDARTAYYRTALGYVLDLAIEFPLYQRKVLYAYNLNVIKESSMPHNAAGELAVNPYTSPLAKIWELEFTD